MLEQPAQGIMDALICLRDRPDASSQLASIKCPTMALCGRYDALTNCESMRQMASSISGAVFCEVQDAGHLANLENPPAFNRHLDTFLAMIDASVAHRC
jgi:pimeloyl-ACP methyl ester carboxylesterase